LLLKATWLPSPPRAGLCEKEFPPVVTEVALWLTREIALVALSQRKTEPELTLIPAPRFVARLSNAT
jgi:hypothetical protein